MLVFYPLYFFFLTRLNSGLVLLLESCNPYLTVFANLTIVPISTSLPMHFHRDYPGLSERV